MFRLLLVMLLGTGCVASDAPEALPGIDVAARSTPQSSTTVTWRSTDAWAHLPPTFPNPRVGSPLFDRIRDVLRERPGTCTTCNIVFGFDDDVERVTAHYEAAGGAWIPAETEWLAESRTLTMRPASGHALEPGRRYVARLAATGADGLEVVAQAELRTGEPAAELRAARAAILREPAPTAAVDRVWRADQLDELLGNGQTAPGLDRSGEGDEFAVRHETTSIVVSGSFDAPRFVTGTGADVGVLVRKNGAPVPTGTDDVPFVLIVPKQADLQNLPVAIVHHGFASSRTTAMVLADTAGRAGWAVLGIDAYQHGARAHSSTDRRNLFRGTEQPDGFAETTMLDVVSRVFGLGGVPTELQLCPEYALSAFTQFVADALSTVRFVRDGELGALRIIPGLEQLQFDRERAVFVGNSMGAVVGTGVIAAEPSLAGAVLNVMPGSIIETLVESGEFRPMSERVFLPLLGVEHRFDPVERRMLFDPTVDVFRWVMEPVDPLALAHARVVDHVLVQLAGQDEVAAPRPSMSVVQAGAIEQVTVYEGAMHGMLEVAEQDSEFEQPLVPPLARRDEPIRLANPIEAVHDEITDFLLAIDAR